MSEYAVFDLGERMFNRASAQSHCFRRNALLHPAQRDFVQMAGIFSSNNLTINLIMDNRCRSPYNFHELLIS